MVDLESTQMRIGPGNTRIVPKDILRSECVQYIWKLLFSDFLAYELHELSGQSDKISNRIDFFIDFYLNLRDNLIVFF